MTVDQDKFSTFNGFDVNVLRRNVTSYETGGGGRKLMRMTKTSKNYNSFDVLQFLEI